MTGTPTAPIDLTSVRLLAPRSSTRARLLVPLAMLLLLGSALGLGALAGLSCFVVESPSMGRTAPVGTLVVAARTDPAALRVGDVITYRSQERPGTTVTHRIVERVRGGFVTRGDINGGADAGVVRTSMVVGRDVALVPRIGWLIRLAPWLTIGFASVWALTLPVVSDPLRAALRIIGACAVLTSALLVMRPLIAWTVLSRVPVADGAMTTVVATGLLPVRLAARGGGSVDAQPGEVVRLLLPADHLGRVLMSSGPALDAAGAAVLVGVCLLPLLGVLVVGLPPGKPRTV